MAWLICWALHWFWLQTYWAQEWRLVLILNLWENWPPVSVLNHHVLWENIAWFFGYKIFNNLNVFAMLSFNSSKTICPSRISLYTFYYSKILWCISYQWCQCLIHNRTLTTESYLAAVSSKPCSSPNPGKETGWTIPEQ